MLTDTICAEELLTYQYLGVMCVCMHLMSMYDSSFPKHNSTATTSNACLSDQQPNLFSPFFCLSLAPKQLRKMCNPSGIHPQRG